MSASCPNTRSDRRTFDPAFASSAQEKGARDSGSCYQLPSDIVSQVGRVEHAGRAGNLGKKISTAEGSSDANGNSCSVRTHLRSLERGDLRHEKNKTCPFFMSSLSPPGLREWKKEKKSLFATFFNSHVSLAVSRGEMCYTAEEY